MLWLMKNFFDQPLKSDMRTYDSILKIATGQGDDYTTGCLLDYNYFNKHYKMIALNLSKQQVLDADLKAIQRDNGAKMFFIIEEANKTVLDFLQGTVEGILF